MYVSNDFVYNTEIQKLWEHFHCVYKNILLISCEVGALEAAPPIVNGSIDSKRFDFS